MKLLRELRGFTQSELAQHTRLNGQAPTQSYISRIERGTIDPPVSYVRSLATCLKVPAWYLLVELGEGSRFWPEYLGLSGEEKKSVQRYIRRLTEHSVSAPY